MARAAKKKNTHEPDLKAFFDYLNEVSTEKGLSRDEVVETFKGSLITAYQRKYGVDANLEVIMDRETPEIAVICRRKVLDPVLNPAQEISTAEAQKIQPGIKEGEVLEVRENPFEFSRIGATNVRQILLQRLKELEREILYNDFKAREGDLVNGYFLRWRDKDLMYIDLGKLEGVMPRREQIPNEKFRPGDRVKAVIKLVELRREKSREPGPFVTLSRASGDFVKKLFEMEIPEIYDGVVEISGIARYAGYRTKILVRSNRMDVDPVGACVGVRGVRIQSVVRELGNERIDIVNDTGNVSDIIASAMSPATVTEVRVDPSTREALVLVPDDQQSKAIGNGGQNVRLASQLSRI
jgi:N utilization substance protein A